MPVNGAKGKGQARISENHPSDNMPIAKKIMMKYLGSVKHARAKQILYTVKSGKSVLLQITLLYFSAWDFSKGA